MIGDILCILKQFFYWCLNQITDLLNLLISPLLNLLPDSPFTFEPLQWGSFGHLVGYFIPVSKMLAHFTLLIGAIIIYYSISHLLRIVRMVK